MKGELFLIFRMIGGLTKEDIGKYFETYLKENDYPDGPFELLELAKVQHQIDFWRVGF